MNRTAPLLLLVALATTAADCERGQEGEAADVAPATSTPVPATRTRLIGPQPGPDIPMRPMENPWRGDAAIPAEGYRLFVWYNCYGCHGGHAGGGMGPSLRDRTWIYGDQPADIFSSIAEGRAHGMPAWGVKVPAEDIWKMVAYIESLGTGDEPVPPPPLPPRPPAIGP